MKKKPRIDVGCAVIRRQGRLLIAQRLSASNLAGFWEFPGGKRESGESLEDCLRREVMEELGVRIRPRERISRKEHVCPDRILDLHFCLCDFEGGEPVAMDCLDFKWVRPEELYGYRFPPADEDLIHDLVTRKAFFFPGQVPSEAGSKRARPGRVFNTPVFFRGMRQ